MTLMRIFHLLKASEQKELVHLGRNAYLESKHIPSFLLYCSLIYSDDSNIFKKANSNVCMSAQCNPLGEIFRVARANIADLPLSVAV